MLANWINLAFRISPNKKAHYSSENCTFCGWMGKLSCRQVVGVSYAKLLKICFYSLASLYKNKLRCAHVWDTATRRRVKRKRSQLQLLWYVCEKLHLAFVKISQVKKPWKARARLLCAVWRKKRNRGSSLVFPVQSFECNSAKSSSSVVVVVIRHDSPGCQLLHIHFKTRHSNGLAWWNL